MARRAVAVAALLTVAGVMGWLIFAHAEEPTLIRLGPGHSPQWSPDGQLIAFVHDGWLQVTPPREGAPRARIAALDGTQYLWADDTTLVYGDRPKHRWDTTFFRSVNVGRDVSAEDKSIASVRVGIVETLIAAPGDSITRTVIVGPVKLPDGTVGYYRADRSPVGPACFVPFNPEAKPTERERGWRNVYVRTSTGNMTAPGWGSLWLKPVVECDAPAVQLTRSEAYGLPLLSPQGDRVVALSLDRQCWVVFDTTGAEINPRMNAQYADEHGLLHGASGYSWSSDGELLAYVQTAEDVDRIRYQRLFYSSTRSDESLMLLDSLYGFIGQAAWAPNGGGLCVSTNDSGLVIVRIH